MPVVKTLRHEIKDGAGALKAIHVRKELSNGGKYFEWRRPNGAPGLNGTRPNSLPLYGAERLKIWDPKKSIVIVEGEKKCEALWRIEVPALGTVTGANGCPERAVFSDLRDRRVILWQDADAPGRLHMDRVAQALSGIAAEVRLLTWGEPGSKDDAADFVARGGTRCQLVEMVRGAPTWEAPGAAVENTRSAKAATAGLPLVRIGDLLAEPDEERRWLVDGLLPQGGLSLLAAKPKVGKSTLARCLCASVAAGEPWLGAVTRTGPVLYLGLEEKREEVKRHFRSLGVGADAPLLVYVELPPQDAIEQLRQSVAVERPALVVVDGLFRLIRAADANAYAELYAKLTPLLALARESSAHVLLTHHEGKGAGDRDGQDGVLGSTAIVGTVDVTFALRKERATGRRTIQSTTRYGEDLAERVLLMDDAGRVTLGDTREVQERADAKRSIMEALAGKAEPMTEDSLEDLVKAKTGTFRSALRELFAAGEVSRSGAGKKGDPYHYGIPVSSFPHMPGNEKRESQKIASILAESSFPSVTAAGTRNAIRERESGPLELTPLGAVERGEL
jgi:hypothetical protein